MHGDGAFDVTFWRAMPTMGNPMNDAELVERSRRQDAEAFGALVERHQRLVFGVALARCQDPALAEDVAQEAFVMAWRDLGRLRDGDRVGSWVAGIARNLAASAARQRARQAEIEVPPPSAVPTPEDEALAREDRDLLRRALAEVPEQHRETLVLFYLEGQSVSAIAEALGIREDLVKQRLSRGRKALRDHVETRVESALTRARTSPAFKAGVVAAIVATTREAKAATAGKAISMLTTKKLAIAGAATLALAGGAVWMGTRARAEDSRSGAKTTAASSTTASGVSPDKQMVRKLANPTVQRPPLLASIRQAHERRTSAAVPTPNSPPSQLAKDASGDFDKDYIRACVRELIPLITECYEEGLLRDNKIEGTVVVDFTIEGEPGVGGLVGESTIDDKESTLTDPEVRECIQATMYALQIDPPANGGIVKVHYPFAFSRAAP